LENYSDRGFNYPLFFLKKKEVGRMDYKYTIKAIKVLYDKTPIKQVKNHVLKFGLKEGVITGVILGALVSAIKNKKEGK
jgi:hypothetical protein